MEKEIWKVVRRHKTYKVSNLGNIKNSRGQILSNRTLRGGYPSVSLGVSEQIHILVAEAFVLNKNPEKFKIVNHLDGNKRNARADNLEWTDNSGNVRHALDTGLLKPFTRKVHQCDTEGNVIATFGSIKEAAEKTGASSKHIPSVCTGKRKSCGGYGWKYVDDPKVDLPEGRPIQNFDRYIICKNGKVYNTETCREKLPSTLPAGYQKVDLSKDGKVKTLYVHRLVAKAYLKQPPNKRYVNHIDGKKDNNNVSNLEWCTHPENMVHAANIIKYKTVGVSQFEMDGTLIESFPSVISASKKSGVDNSSIVKACKNKVKHAGGYIWKYVE